MIKPLLNEKFTDNGEHSHWELIDSETGEILCGNIDTLALKKKRFIPPSVEVVRAYCIKRKNNVDPEKFVNFYEAKGWMIGKNKMKNWEAGVRTWERLNPPQNGTTGKPNRDTPL